MDVKTITVSIKTHRELEELKERTGARSFDQLLSRLAGEKVGAKSMFGAAKGVRSGFSREHRERT